MKRFFEEAIIIIKYTQFIPAESKKENLYDFSKKGCIPKEDYGNDNVWHDYFILFETKTEEWVVFDVKFIELINKFREKNQYPICPHNYSYSIHFKNLDELKILLKGDIFSFESVCIPFIKPVYFETLTVAGRTFENLPVLLGHVSLEKMLSLFQINYAPFAVKKNKITYLPDSERWAIKKEHPFAAQLHLAAGGRFLLDLFFTKQEKLDLVRRRMGTLSLGSLPTNMSMESQNKIRKRSKSLSIWLSECR
jgi:hypothetical protein